MLSNVLYAHLLFSEQWVRNRGECHWKICHDRTKDHTQCMTLSSCATILRVSRTLLKDPLKAAQVSCAYVSHFILRPLRHAKHMYVYLYIHTYIHAYMHTCIHACMHTCIHAYMHTCIDAYMHTCIHTYIHTHTQRDFEHIPCNPLRNPTVLDPTFLSLW